jgi:hypothetical protein
VVAPGKVGRRGSHWRWPAQRRSKAATELRWSGRASSPTTGGGDGGGEARSKRRGRWGHDGAHRGGRGKPWRGSTKTARRRLSVRPARTRGRGKRGRGDGVRGCALAREDERGKKGGCDGDGAPFIGDVVGLGDRPRVAPRDGEAWGAWGHRGGQVARRGRQRPSRGASRRRMTSAETGEGGG